MLRQNIFLRLMRSRQSTCRSSNSRIVGRIAFQQRRGGAIHGHDGRVAPPVAVPARYRDGRSPDTATNQPQTLPCRRSAPKAPTCAPCETQFEQGFRGRVHEQHPQPPVQHQHGDAQTFHNPTMVIFQHVCLVFRPPSVNKQKPNQFNTDEIHAVRATFAIRHSAVNAPLLRAIPNHRSIMHHNSASNRFGGLTTDQMTTPVNGGVHFLHQAIRLQSQPGMLQAVVHIELDWMVVMRRRVTSACFSSI